MVPGNVTSPGPGRSAQTFTTPLGVAGMQKTDARMDPNGSQRCSGSDSARRPVPPEPNRVRGEARKVLVWPPVTRARLGNCRTAVEHDVSRTAARPGLTKIAGGIDVYGRGDVVRRPARREVHRPEAGSAQNVTPPMSARIVDVMLLGQEENIATARIYSEGVVRVGSKGPQELLAGRAFSSRCPAVV